MLLRLAIAVGRAWTRIYTAGLPGDTRESRRIEIESDLWEAEHDLDPGPGVASALHVLARLLIGVTDDLGWRFEQEEIVTERVKSYAAAVALVTALLAVWIVVASIPSSAPALPEAPQPARTGIGHLPPPSPPPPPPTPGSDSRSIQRHLFGRTSYSAANGVRAPIRINDVRPVYPPIAVGHDLRGVVVLEATIDETGRVVETRIVRSIPVLDHAAVNAVRQWRFEPTVVDGVPVRVGITVTAAFDL